jgi:hypothetical protein
MQLDGVAGSAQWVDRLERGLIRHPREAGGESRAAKSQGAFT